MIKELELVLSPHDASDELFYKQEIANQLHLTTDDITYIRLLKRSVDARKGKINVRLKAEIFINETPSDVGIIFPAYLKFVRRSFVAEIFINETPPDEF